MKKNNIIFVGGIHGVGKTILCKRISTQLLIEHYSCSELISMLDAKKIGNDKIVHDVNNNQNVLLNAAQRLLDDENIYLLDGHFCLINNDYLIKRIPINIYESLRIKGIILLTCDEKIILDRLKRRDGKDYSLEFIQLFQQKEIEYGKYVADKIKVPIKMIDLTRGKVETELIVRDLLGNIL
ncbi:MAG TPA: ATP-binding protein [Oscillospiraceae bacterium]|nr:ATP-binding protein [Oscillospiraceae bacterium]